MMGNQLVAVPLPGGRAVLYLTAREFTRGLRRGKAIRRAEERRRRAEQRHKSAGTPAATSGVGE